MSTQSERRQCQGHVTVTDELVPHQLTHPWPHVHTTTHPVAITRACKSVTTFKILFLAPVYGRTYTDTYDNEDCYDHQTDRLMQG